MRLVTLRMPRMPGAENKRREKPQLPLSCAARVTVSVLADHSNASKGRNNRPRANCPVVHMDEQHGAHCTCMEGRCSVRLPDSSLSSCMCC